MKKNQKKTSRGITLIALVITVIVLLILAGISISMLTGENGILNQAAKASENTKDVAEEEQVNLAVLAALASETGEITTENLQKEIQSYFGSNATIEGNGPWIYTGERDSYTISKDGNITKLSSGIGGWNGTVNTPVLATGMTAVTFDANGNPVEVSSTDTSWYDYENKEWANAITKDSNGNITGYWVWIPRYEYVLDSSTQTATVKFIPVTQTTVDDGYSYIHPAFRDGSSTNYMNGEWDTEISGFWVAKYPAGYQANTITDDNGTLTTTIANSSDTVVYSDKNYTNTGNYTTNPIGTISTSTAMSYPVFKPLTYAYNCITIGDSYTLAQEVAKASSFYGLSSSQTDSHMLKNSEWGAVAYLTQSQYGRNGTEPNINNYYTSTSSPYRVALTGVYASETTTSSTTTLGSAYYTETGVLGSSTGNITGVYDLNGCVWERVAGYITNGNTNLNTYGASFVADTSANPNGYLSLSTKYATVYPYNSSSDGNANNWTEYNELKSETYGYGDAILETSTAGSGSTSWYSDYSNFANSSHPFFSRGGYYSNGSNAGAFYFSYAVGGQSNGNGFRVVLVCQ